MPSNNSPHTKIELSIIVLSYNTAALTKQTVESILTSLKAARFGYEIIVFDNASKDKSVEFVRVLSQKFKQITLIAHHENLGFSKGNNEAVTLAHGSYILFLNSDIIIQDDAISKLFEYYKNNQQSIHFLGGKLFNKDGSLQPSGGPFYSLPVVFGALFAKGDHWGFSRQSPDKITQIDWVSGACILTTKKIFSKLNGFDEKIFMYMDEIDLLYRAKKMHYNTYFYPYAPFIHLGSASSEGKTYPILQVYKGFKYFYKKHHSSLSISLLLSMLQLKALIAIWIGKLTKNQYLTETYAKALEIAKMA
ncbi:hypothetical protein CO051_05965 [Candidatus Roizmanbacteria bacterium CG_4_9_14_0_2_um_filter_39_13]|uniref:Glycosyltransferase 2-like domain-containing protein n=2 Tax=Candidatus Roizmaniibacteriota TaxID=1752723 RepID=A0A2M8EWW4_9BACT|nr:MAG: hypothetical protein COY15_04430 [Candidatus Roizmanbacteria bacterium CG_4_10_14_0_2_um_filter_39_12]PJC30368.1 MAG: hypothetical protein CO051_05965 [Candidatus Roizmanbacteria bacterium CG_4_9_14_0_2_um_filter_39_13]PJE61359.1 MAG: hypothetical protein COU87_05055 [Candidatus Roizmanbacteria bacterium CG10_big_fil_rev_8_21_14_0_10_39_12]